MCWFTQIQHEAVGFVPQPCFVKPTLSLFYFCHIIGNYLVYITHIYIFPCSSLVQCTTSLAHDTPIVSCELSRFETQCRVGIPQTNNMYHYCALKTPIYLTMVYIVGFRFHVDFGYANFTYFEHEPFSC